MYSHLFFLIHLSWSNPCSQLLLYLCLFPPNPSFVRFALILMTVSSRFLPFFLLSPTKPIVMQYVSERVSWSTSCWAVWLRMHRLTMISLIASTKPCWSVSLTNSPMWGFRLLWPWPAFSSQQIQTVQPSLVCFLNAEICDLLSKIKNNNYLKSNYCHVFLFVVFLSLFVFVFVYLCYCHSNYGIIFSF